MQTCRHFRNQVPREVADELRDADPQPCPICDAMPHRQPLPVVVRQNPKVQPALARSVPEPSNWLTGVLAFLRHQRA